MRKTLKRIIATMLAAVTIGTPATAWGGDYCATGTLVKSHATGGDYVAGILIYETMGSVARSESGGSSTSTASATGQLGVPGTGAGGTVTTSQTTTRPTTTVTTEEPIGFYAMNDGSVYEINCVTGEARQVGTRG
jgi:hypothetical protein